MIVATFLISSGKFEFLDKLHNLVAKSNWVGIFSERQYLEAEMGAMNSQHVERETFSFACRALFVT